MDMLASPLQVLDQIDGVQVPGAWAGAVVQALDYLWAGASPEDRAILFPLGGFLAAHATDLAALRVAGSSGGQPPTGTRQTHSVSTALLLFRPDLQFPGLNQLLLVLATAAIEVGTKAPREQRNRIGRLATIIRGALEDRGSVLRLILEDARSLPKLILSIDTQIRDSGEQLHQTFAAIWRQWLRSTLIRWIQADPEQLSAALRPHALVADIEAPELGFGGGQDIDDQSTVHSDLTESSPPSGPDTPGSVRRKRAIAYGMLRRSGGDLHLPVDQIAPPELVSTLVTATMQAAKTAAADGRLVEAEGPAALALVLATGIRELDLQHVVWGKQALGKVIAVDPEHPCLYRAVCMPPNAVRPDSRLDGWLETVVEQVTWPLPPSLHQVLRQLSPAGKPKDGAAVLPLRSKPAADRYQLWTISQELAPEISLGASQVRLALAAELTQRFGPEVAQLMLGDTFSLSAAPAHYAAPRFGDVVAAISNLQKRWFGETADLLFDTPQTLGSKLLLTDASARRWPAQLRQRIRSASHLKDGAEIAQWRAHRDHLAGALGAATGARPNSWLGGIDLDQVVPEFGVVVITDKASDMLRQTRIAATGRRWMADLRLYLDRLGKLAAGAGGPDAVHHAQRVLRSEAPLFSLPGSEGGPLTVAAFRHTMPEPLQDVPNQYRHRLNACLFRAHLDPELRHAQLGWVVTPAHALADLSPWSAKAFGAAMAPILDEIMVRDGWYPATQRTPAWTWNGVPERALKDWAEVTKVHAADHQQNVRLLKAKLLERWKEVSGDVCERLAQAIVEYFPSLHVDTKARRLEHSTEIRKPVPVEMSLAHYGLLCDRVRQGDREPNDATEGVAARILLFRLILGARSRGVVKGPYPSKPILSVTADPSPFLPGLGLAVRHAEALRHLLLERASEGRAHDQGPLATSSVLACSPYRHLDLAMAAVDAASKAMRSHGRPDCIRIPAVVERELIPMAFGGLPALLLARRGLDAPTARAPEPEQVAAWMRRKLALPMPIPENDAEFLQRIESLFQATGRLELSGPERTVMLGHSALASVSVERSVARDDRWPLHTAVDTNWHDQRTKEATYEDEPVPPRAGLRASSGHAIAKGYARLVAALDPESFPKLTGSKSDSHRGWRGKLEKYLLDLQAEFGERTNLDLLIGFTRHRLRYGGRRKRHLKHKSLTWMTRFASDLLAVAGMQSILDWDTEAFHAGYLAVLVGKPITARRQTFDALITFHRYLVEIHQAPEIPLAELAAFAGDRVRFFDPGMLTDLEVERVLEELQADAEAEQARDDATPEAVRLLELRGIMYLILMGSGIRPSSAFGLTLGDVVLICPGRDFVRIRTSGGYGRAKSTASLGFIPLEGVVWEQQRHRLVAWLEREKVLLRDSTWWKVPLFAANAGEKRRFNRSFITRRIDELLKWVTSNRKAHTYWLRKNCITSRFERVMALEQPMAHHVYAAMCASGHVLIQTPLQSYISDPAIVFERQLREGRFTSRADILAVTNQDGPQLDMAWFRAGGARSPQRMATVLGRLRSEPVEPIVERLTDPPPLKRRQEITPRHIDTYARALHRYNDRTAALLHTGLSARQAEALDRHAKFYISRKGLAPWSLKQLRHERSVLKPPRHLEGTSKLFALLDVIATSDTDAMLLAESFSEQSHVIRFHTKGVIMELPTTELVDAARRLLTATDTDLMLGTSAGMDVLQTPGGEDKRKSHAAGFQWVMVILCIYGRFRGD